MKLIINFLNRIAKIYKDIKKKLSLEEKEFKWIEWSPTSKER